MCEGNLGNLLPNLPERRMGYRCFGCKKNVKERKRYFLGYYQTGEGEEVSKKHFRKLKRRHLLFMYFTNKVKPDCCPHCGDKRVMGYYK